MLKGRHILITGGSEGIGYACAERAIHYGAKITITGRRENKLLAAKEKLGENCSIFVGDASDPEISKQAVAFAVESMGTLDGLVNNVGAAKTAPIFALSDEQFDWTLKTCLYSCMYGVREAGAYMIANHIKGSIVNMSSLNGHVPAQMMVPYTSAKGGINMLTKSASMDLGPYGIRVNAVAPGFTHTAAQEGLYQAPPIVEEVASHVPLEGHDIMPEEIGEVVAFLLSSRASAITGELITVDGGMQNTAYPDVFGVAAKMMAAQNQQ